MADDSYDSYSYSQPLQSSYSDYVDYAGEKNRKKKQPEVTDNSDPQIQCGNMIIQKVIYFQFMILCN